MDTLLLDSQISIFFDDYGNALLAQGALTVYLYGEDARAVHRLVEDDPSQAQINKTLSHYFDWS